MSKHLDAALAVIDAALSEPICAHPAEADCGCWTDDDGKVRRHAFRFQPGDRVCPAGVFKGVRGTVIESFRNGGEYVVKWDDCWQLGTMYRSNFEICHVEED